MNFGGYFIMTNLLLDVTQQQPSVLGMLMPMVILFAVFYFFIMRPQKKREKQTQEMRSSIEVGDEVVTIGGIVGRVVSLKDDTMVIESGTDRSKIRIARWAVQTNATPREEPKKEVTEK